MKKIEAIIQPFMLSRVVHALRDARVGGVTVTDVRGFGREKDESYPHHAEDYAVDFTPKVKMDILCHDQDMERLVQILRTHAHTGRRGDGKIFVTDVSYVVSIRSGAEADDAL